MGPSEIEGVLLEQDGVIDAGVAGVYDPIKSNEAIHAFVVLSEGVSFTGTLPEIRALLMEKVRQSDGVCSH